MYFIFWKVLPEIKLHVVHWFCGPGSYPKPPCCWDRCVMPQKHLCSVRMSKFHSSGQRCGTILHLHMRQGCWEKCQSLLGLLLTVLVIIKIAGLRACMLSWKLCIQLVTKFRLYISGWRYYARSETCFWCVFHEKQCAIDWDLKVDHSLAVWCGWMVIWFSVLQCTCFRMLNRWWKPFDDRRGMRMFLFWMDFLRLYFVPMPMRQTVRMRVLIFACRLVFKWSFSK